jgi:hypothetical protein
LKDAVHHGKYFWSACSLLLPRVYMVERKTVEGRSVFPSNMQWVRRRF